MPKLSDEEILRRAAAIMGKRGGSRRTEKQRAAHVEAAQNMNSQLTPEKRKSAAAKVPKDVRAANGRASVAARWGDREAGMSNEEFRELCAEFTAQEISDAIDVPYNRVITWRRKVKPVLITVEDAKKIRKMVEKAQRARTGKRADHPAK